jgi:ribosomal subunit interface protein
MNLEKFMIAAVAVLFLCVVQAYVHLPMAWKASSPLGLDITSRDVDLTDAMKVRIEEKIGKVIHKLGRDALSSHVVLKINRLPATEHHTHTVKKNSHMAEVTVGFKGGHVVHAAEKSDDMYGSIDSVAHKLGHLLQKHHSKVVDKSHKARVSLAKSLTAEVLEVSEGRDEGREEQGDGREDRVTSKHDDVEEEDTMLELDMQYRNTDRVSGYHGCDTLLLLSCLNLLWIDLLIPCRVRLAGGSKRKAHRGQEEAVLHAAHLHRGGHHSAGAGGSPLLRLPEQGSGWSRCLYLYL